MFNFFCNLAYAIYNGSWVTQGNYQYISHFIAYMKVVPIFGLFNNSTEAFYNTSTPLGAEFTGTPDLCYTICVILSTICCISVFFIIVRSIRKIFSCFLEWF